MAKLMIELPYSYDQKDIAQWLGDYGLTHLKSHGEYWIKSGDALRSAKGVIARVVWDGRNEVGEPHIVIANNKLSTDEMHIQFCTDQQKPTQIELLSKFSEAVGYEPDLMYVSPEVGYVDQDEEYR